MENNIKNNPKKSKALIITIVIVLLLLIIGYFLFVNSAKIFGTKGVTNSNKIFSPLITSDSSKNLTPIDALAGEDIAKGDSVSVTGRDANGAPIVVKTTTNGGAVFGYANQNIKNGSIGPIVSSSPSLWNSFTNFIGNMFGGNQTTTQALGGSWSSGDNGNTGTFTGSNGSGAWTATNGTGGTGIATWTGTGNGTGTWTSSTGSGTWTNGTGTGGAGTGTWGTATVGGTWSTGNNGNTGTFDGSNGSGTWIATSGTGGTGIVTWTGTGNGTGTWTSGTGSGTWTNGTGTGGAGTGTWGTSQTGYTWSSGDNGNTGTFTGSNGSGAWTATNGTGGTGIATWTGTGNGTGTWTSSTGSGTWTNGTGTGGAGTGTWGTATVGGTWSTGNNGNTGTFDGSNGSGAWTATNGTGGTGIVTWTGTGNGTGTWTSSTGSGTWTNGTGTGGAGTGTWGNAQTESFWSSGDNGNTGIFNGGNGSGTWTATNGTGGTGIVTWTGTGNGTGTWTSSTGSGTWTNGTGTGGAGTGTWGIGTGGAETGPSSYIGETSSKTTGTWVTSNNGSNGTFDGSNGSGTWTTLNGTGGVSGATWTGTGNGTGTWTSSTGSGTWTNGTGTGGAGTGTWGTLGGGSNFYNTANGWSYNYSNSSWTPPSSSNLPSVALTATSTSITSGSNTTIEWKSLKTSSCNDDVTGRAKTTSGSFNTGALTTSTSFSVICVNNKGAKASGNIYIKISNENPYPSVALTATPTSVALNGRSVINWTSLNTTSCNANTTRANTKSGSFTTPPLTTGTSFSVTCIDAKGSEVSASIYVGISTIGGGSSDYDINNALIVTVTADPLSVSPKSSSDITWSASAENTTSCNDTVTGRTNGLTGTFNTGPLTSGKEFSVVCKGPNGSSSGNVTVSVIGENDPPIVSVTATPATVASGTTSRIDWTALNASSCNMGTTRDKTIEGYFITGKITTDTSYTVSCIGAHGTGSATVYVFVSGVTTCPNGGIPPNCNNIPTDGSSSYNTCTNGADNYPDCTTINGKCTNSTDNPPDCTTINGECANGSTNPPVCNNFGQTCAAGYTGTIPNCILETQTCEDPGPVDFTPEEEAGIEALLRRYYALSDSIKSENDLISTNNDADKTKSIITNAKNLTKQCYLQTGNEDGYANFYTENRTAGCLSSGDNIKNNVGTWTSSTGSGTWKNGTRGGGGTGTGSGTWGTGRTGNNGTWGTGRGSNGNTGTFTGSNGSGTWTATTGTGGTGIGTWITTGVSNLPKTCESTQIDLPSLGNVNFETYDGPKNVRFGNPWYSPEKDSYIYSIWPIYLYSLETKDADNNVVGKYSFDVTKDNSEGGFGMFAQKEDIEMDTGTTYFKKLTDNYNKWPGATGPNDDAWENSYLLEDDWAALNAESNRTGEQATATFIESLFKIW